MTEEYRRYTIGYVVKAFAEAGYPVSAAWLRRQEEKGNLIVPKSTTDFKKAYGARRNGAVRLFSKTQIDDIVKAFLPGGKGYYNYTEEENHENM